MPWRRTTQIILQEQRIYGRSATNTPVASFADIGLLGAFEGSRRREGWGVGFHDGRKTNRRASASLRGRANNILLSISGALFTLADTPTLVAVEQHVWRTFSSSFDHRIESSDGNQPEMFCIADAKDVLALAAGQRWESGTVGNNSAVGVTAGSGVP